MEPPVQLGGQHQVGMSVALLSSAYFGPVQWYQKLCRFDDVWIDADEPFLKQTYRNRCVIAAANGLQSLTVPVAKAPILRDVRVSDHGNWRHLHWQALVSAYGESPFFEYYADDLRPFFERKWEFLFDFNMEITHKMCELLDIEATPKSLPPSVSHDGMADFRQVINPKHPQPDADFQPRPYYQVFAQRHGFQPNLSVLDLLFNMGNESIFYLL